MNNRHRTTGHQKGLDAEKWAAFYLRLKGYRVLATRYRTKLGEIDLIVRRGNVLAFVEVKRRGTEDEGAEAIHAGNQARVRRAAELYLQKYPRYTVHDMRFDAVVFGKGLLPRHVTGAF
jgi:putative endonuclease